MDEEISDNNLEEAELDLKSALPVEALLVLRMGENL